jgi:outer membrane receptor protein involved in Fe transport
MGCLMPALVSATSAAAQQRNSAEDVLRALPSINVIATAPAGVTGSFFTLSRADWAPFDPPSAVDVLRQVPGVAIDRSGSSGSVGSLYLRGGDPNWTAVFLDGVRINDPTNSRGGSVDLSFLDPGMIERIDVIRGPASALVGSDAISGAIDIVARAPSDARHISIHAEAGTRGYDRVDARGTGAVASAATSIYAGASESGSQVEGGATRLRTLASRLRSGADMPGRLDVAVHAFDATAHAFPDDSGGPRYAVIRDVDRRRAEEQDGSIRYRLPDLDLGHVSLLATFLDRREADVSPGVAPGVRDPAGIPPNRSDTHYQRQTLRVMSETAIGGGLRIAV